MATDLTCSPRRDLALNGGRFTDEYVKLVFLADGFDYPEPLDLDAVRETMPQEAWPVLRTYTIRWIDHEAQELADRLRRAR